MKAVTAIAIGFMNGDKDIVQVLTLTVSFIGRKLTRSELNNIVRAYKNKNAMR